jgi:hypothetical protein
VKADDRRSISRYARHLGWSGSFAKSYVRELGDGRQKMKRKGNPNAGKYHAKLGDIKSDFTPEQLAAIGAVAMNYNETEVPWCPRPRLFDLRPARAIPAALRFRRDIFRKKSQNLISATLGFDLISQGSATLGEGTNQ